VNCLVGDAELDGGVQVCEYGRWRYSGSKTYVWKELPR
jgi:hypothetical protein